MRRPAISFKLEGKNLHACHPNWSFHRRLARAVLGADEHKKFLAAGGNSQDINMAWLVMQQEYEDAKEGEEDPK